LVEKVRVPGSCISFTCKEGERSLNSDVKCLGVQRSETFRWEDMRLSIVPCQAGPARCSSFQAKCPSQSFGSQVPCSVVCSPRGSPLDSWPLSSLAKSGGVIPSTGYLTPFVWLLVELVMSRLLGHNRWPTVPGVQDSNSSPRAFRQAGSQSWSLVGWQNGSSHGTMRATMGFGDMTGAQGLHDHVLESHGGALPPPRVAPDAMPRLGSSVGD
jgi:hypothetical protein